MLGVEDVKRPDVVVLYSGGADSMMMLLLADFMKRTPFCILIDYEQLHIKELDFAEAYLQKKSINYKIVKLQNLTAGSALTTGEKGLYQGVSIYHVPGRNTMFLAIALSEAETRGIKEVWYGPDYSDKEHLFPDCYQEYVYRMNQVSEISGSYPIKIYAPLLGLTKEMILSILENFRIPKEDYYSGYGEFA
jgi:7-cyano-7-deazaguanine synthase